MSAAATRPSWLSVDPAAIPRELTAEDFLRLFWGDANDLPGDIVVWKLEGEESRWFPVGELTAAARATTKIAERHNAYVGMALQDKAAALAEAERRERKATAAAGRDPRPIRELYVRGYSQTAAALAGFWYEIDVGGAADAGAHKKERLASSLEEALALLREFPLPPTLVVFSGHGIHVYWLFREPWVFADDEEREGAQDLLWRLQHTLHAKAEARGWDTDSTHDLARVLRPLGTFNRKPGLAPVPVRALELDASRRYNPDDFEPYLLDPDAIKAKGHAEPAELPADLPTIDVHSLPLPRRLREVIETGRYIDPETRQDRAPSSSERTWHAVNAMIELGLDNATIAAVFLDPRYRIGDRVREKRGSGRTWIAAELGRARKHQESKAEAKGAEAELVFGTNGATAEPPTQGGDGAEACVTCGQAPDRIRQLAAENARLRRAVIDRDDLIDVQKTIIGNEQAENREHRARFQEFKAVLANPEMSGNEKVIALVVAGEAHAPAQPLEGPRAEWAKVSLQGKPEEGWIGLGEKAGLTGNTISTTLGRLSRGDEAPFDKRLTREWRTRADGAEGWVTTVMVRPRAEHLSDTLRAIARFRPDKPKHGGSEAAMAAREEARRCPRHPDAELVASTTWRCSVCRAIVDERPVLDHKVGDPGSLPAAVGVGRTPGHEVRDPAATNGRAGAQDHQVGDPADGNGHDSENGAHDRAALEMVVTPLGSDRANGDQDYSRSSIARSDAPRLLTTSRVGAGGHGAEHPPPATIPRPGRACICGATDLVYRAVWEDYACSQCGVTAPAPLDGAGP